MMKNIAITMAVFGAVSGFGGEFSSQKAEASTPLCVYNHVSLMRNTSPLDSLSMLPRSPNFDLEKWSKYCFFDKPEATSFGYRWRMLHQIHNNGLFPAIHIDEPVKYHV